MAVALFLTALPMRAEAATTVAFGLDEFNEAFGSSSPNNFSYDETIVKDGVTLSFDQGDATYKNDWNPYSGKMGIQPTSYLKLSTNEPITKVTFSGSGLFTADSGTFNDFTWTGNALSIEFYAVVNCSISQIEVELNGEGGDDPQTPEDPVNPESGEPIGAELLLPSQVTGETVPMSKCGFMWSAWLGLRYFASGAVNLIYGEDAIYFNDLIWNSQDGLAVGQYNEDHTEITIADNQYVANKSDDGNTAKLYLRPVKWEFNEDQTQIIFDTNDDGSYNFCDAICPILADGTVDTTQYFFMLWYYNTEGYSENAGYFGLNGCTSFSPVNLPEEPSTNLQYVNCNYFGVNGTYGDESSGEASFAIDGSDFYLSGIFPYGPEYFLKGKISGNTITFESGQDYIPAMGYYLRLTSSDDAELLNYEYYCEVEYNPCDIFTMTIDYEKGTITLDEGYTLIAEYTGLPLYSKYFDFWESITFSFESSSIEEVNREVQVINVEWYTLDGLKVEKPSNGLMIERKIYSDGTVKTIKHMKAHE